MPRTTPLQPSRKREHYYASKLGTVEAVPDHIPQRGDVLAMAKQAGKLREDKYNLGDIASLLGCSMGYVADLLLLATHGSERLLAALAAGQISPTTAIDLIKAEPKKGPQGALLVKALARARASKRRIVTARHFEIPLGKKRFRPNAEAVHALTEILDQPIGGSEINFTRRSTVRAVLKFLNGSATADDLQRYLHGKEPPPAA